jgi:DNA helicase-2/ATP-dependent DNA helicase PcrA
MALNYTLRPSQTDILRYHGGKLGISAVPGSGKTFTLSALAAQIISSGVMNSDQDVLIVTLVNSAVDNFSSRIGKMVETRGLIPNLGYRVRTLHGLAHDIVREKPSLVGLEDRFQIVDEREAEFIRQEAANAWLATFPHHLDEYLGNGMDESKREWVRTKQLPDVVHGLALAFIRSCKNITLTPEALRTKLDSAPAPLPLAEMGWWVYDKYQQALRYRGAVDFDDLIAFAYRILQLDNEYLARLQYRFPYILEDEAQDSSEIQENILRLLAGHGNWVRVGDPNQAIFETFTTANPKLLRNFITSEADHRKELPVSGRSQPHIIDLANYLIDWGSASHPAGACRDALSTPHIQPAAPDDPQPNPSVDPEGIRFVGRKYTPEEEINAVVSSIKKWLPDHKDWTVAVLVPRNIRGFEVIEALKKQKIDYVDVLASTNKTRVAAGAIANILAYLADPSSASKLSRVYQVWRREWRDDSSNEEIALLRKNLFSATGDLVRKIDQVENFIAPTPGNDWLTDARRGSPDPAEIEQNVIRELRDFRITVNRWLNAVTLPIDQLILTLAQELFTDAADLALAHKLALVLRRAAEDHSDWRLPELTAELGVIARNERRFIGFSSDDSGFDPNAYRGKVVVTTMHKAKGLEWDRVYMMSVNNYDFPSLQPFDRYISEKWFIRDTLNLEAESLAQLKAILSTNEYDWYTEGAASQTARADYCRERLRLLYVGITRAKQDLLITWNSGRQGDAQPSLAMEALRGWWENQSGESAH